jgi:mevalonate kinase
MNAVTAIAPGKVIVMGEHAAVFGRPAIIAALGLYCSAAACNSTQDGVQLDLPDVGLHAAYAWKDIDDYTAAARARWLDYAQRPEPSTFRRMRGADPAHLALVAVGESLPCATRRPRGLSLRVASQIPSGAGFGSSAAVAVAIAAAALALNGDRADTGTLDALALDIERRQHGQPSGIDHGTVLRGGLVRAARRASGGLALGPMPFRRERLRRLQLYHTGAAAEATGHVVSAVRERLARDAGAAAVLASMERATLAFGAWLAGKGDLALGGVAALRDYERCLEYLGVVPPPVRAAIRAIEAAGGAAKISGAGSLAGPGAGALLVLWPGRPALRVCELAGWERFTVPLGMPGLRVERAAEAIA